MGLFLLVLGLVVFIAAHVLVRMRKRRDMPIGRLGETPYKVLVSLVAIVGLALIVYGFARYRADGWIDIWYPPRGLRHATVALMLPAVILAAAAYLPGHIKLWTKQPLLAAIKLWAFAHLLSNGDLGSILLFGTLLGWAVWARIAIKRQERADPPAKVAPGSLGWGNDVAAVVVGVVAYLALGFVFHPAVIGVPVFGV